MCPACIGTTALLCAGATSAGGLAAFLIARLRRSKHSDGADTEATGGGPDSHESGHSRERAHAEVIVAPDAVRTLTKPGSAR